MPEGTITFRDGHTEPCTFDRIPRFPHNAGDICRDDGVITFSLIEDLSRRELESEQFMAAARARCLQNLRICIDAGFYPRKPSRFSDKEQYLPLDLWDSTPDP